MSLEGDRFLQQQVFARLKGAAREIKPGENVTAGDITFRITDTAELVAHLKIPQTELSKFTAGDTATFSVDSMPEAEFAATIERISPTIDTRNGTFRATALTLAPVESPDFLKRSM